MFQYVIFHLNLNALSTVPKLQLSSHQQSPVLMKELKLKLKLNLKLNKFWVFKSN